MVKDSELDEEVIGNHIKVYCLSSIVQTYQENVDTHEQGDIAVDCNVDNDQIIDNMAISS